MPEAISIRLASNSPRRRELMALGNWVVNSCLPEVDETQLAGEVPADYVVRLAVAKARTALQGAVPESFIVAADTAVVDEQTILGKPANARDARRMLLQLRGRAHKVYTGLAVLDTRSLSLLTDVCITEVPMRDYSDTEIDNYVASGDPMDKAGAYGIQHPGFHPVSRMAGCYASVMGMPLCHLMRLLLRLEVSVSEALSQACQDHLGYDCPVSAPILRGELVG